MNRLLLASTALLAVATAASAADLPRRTMAPAPMVAAVPAFTWTGLYVGVHGAWIRNETKAVRAETNLDPDFIPARVSLDEKGFGGGGQIGYLMQFGNIVAGVEADITATDVERARTVTFTAGPTVVDTRVSSNMELFGTVKGRLGFTFPSFLSFFQQTMIYVTGGLGYADVENRARISVTPGFTIGRTNEDTKVGFVVGGGTENAITDNISLKTETIYYNLEDDTITLRSGSGDRSRYRFENEGWISKIGLNVRF